uniref:hypothetical protein n=1 Tax=Gelidibacter sp. TaxID=2018083 RepID=UPI004048EFFC
MKKLSIQFKTEPIRCIIKHRLITILILLSFNINIAQNKVIVPTTGTITFKERETIHDSSAYKEDTKKMIVSMFKKNLENSIPKDEELDTLLISQLLPQFSKDDSLIDSFIMENSKKDISHTMVFYKDSINFFKTSDGTLIGFHKKINLVTSPEPRPRYKESIEKLIKFDETGSDIEFEYYDYTYSNNKILDIKEFRDEIKVINGFQCFKVVYSYQIDGMDKEDDFADFMKNYPQTREVWVTKSIKSLFHPVINDKEIIEKYYPLEIKEYSDSIKGMETIYTLDQLTLN